MFITNVSSSTVHYLSILFFLTCHSNYLLNLSNIICFSGAHTKYNGVAGGIWLLYLELDMCAFDAHLAELTESFVGLIRNGGLNCFCVTFEADFPAKLDNHKKKTR